MDVTLPAPEPNICVMSHVSAERLILQGIHVSIMQLAGKQKDSNRRRSVIADEHVKLVR